MENITQYFHRTSFENAGMFERIWDNISRPKSLLAVVICYLLLVKILRHRRITETNARFPTRESLATMTSAEAQAIVRQVGEYEMPFMQKKAHSFALFRTYGIPSISSLLCETAAFTKYAPKRFADTVALLVEQVGRDIGSKNWIESTSRMNCIHKRYQLAGKISNEDMLYTLVLFVREPIEWIKRYEWRELSDVERCGLTIFWALQGEAMGIEWRGLPTYDAGKKWKDGLHMLEEWTEWAEDYESRHMVPADSNFQTAEETTAILLWALPRALKPFGKQAVIAMMDDRLRIAMKYPPVSNWLVSTLHGLLQFRAFMMRNLSLPRYQWNRVSYMTKDADEHGKYFNLVWDSLPYYVKPTLWNRWGPGALMSRLNKLPVPGDEGQRFCPMGYSVPELGPGHGKKEQKAMEEQVMQIGRRGHIHFGGTK